MAAKRSAQISSRKAKWTAAKAAAPVMVRPAPPTETPRKTPEKFRDRARASLLRRNA